MSDGNNERQICESISNLFNHMNRTRLIDIRLSEGISDIGLCASDLPRIARAANSAQERLLYDKAAGDTGWNGGWAEMVFSVDRARPYITCPRDVARLEAIDVCGKPTPLNNSFFEYLMFGDGRMPREKRWGGWHSDVCQGFSRNNTPLFTDISNPPQTLQIYAANPADYGKRVLVQGISGGSQVYTQDGNANVQGEFVTLAAPFASTKFNYDSITGIQKDVTLGEVQIFQVDPWFGVMELLSVMEPGETTGWYRRYYLSQLPRECCSYKRHVFPGKSAEECGCPGRAKEHVLVTALVKLDLVPMVYDTDYSLITSKEALLAEMKAGRYFGMDDQGATAKYAAAHTIAIRILIGENSHYQGIDNPAVSFKPFGSADLRKINLSMR
jgi:hypothetical protein